MLYKTVSTGSERHTAEFLAGKMEEVIEEVGPVKVGAVVSDNAKPMVKALSILKKNTATLPHIRV